MARKLTKTKRERFEAVMFGALTALGAERDKDGDKAASGYGWTLATRFGPLRLGVEAGTYTFSVFGRFEDLERCDTVTTNPNGKWNHHPGSNDPDKAAQEVISSLRWAV